MNKKKAITATVYFSPSFYITYEVGKSPVTQLNNASSAKVTAIGFGEQLRVVFEDGETITFANVPFSVIEPSPL